MLESSIQPLSQAKIRLKAFSGVMSFTTLIGLCHKALSVEAWALRVAFLCRNFLLASSCFDIYKKLQILIKSTNGFLLIELSLATIVLLGQLFIGSVAVLQFSFNESLCQLIITPERLLFKKELKINFLFCC